MKKKIILRSIVIILIILNVFVMYLLSRPENNRELEDIKVIDLKKDQSIAIMVQDTEGEGWHEQEDRSKWPDPSTHGFVGAECSDSEGATIDWEKVLTFSLANKTATIKTKQTAYCTLYFAKGEPALDWLRQKGGATFAGSAHTTVIDGMYRFVGTKDTVTNNYICFGTTIESECLKTPETYMYRIIGITSAKDETIGLYANQLKIIKATPSSTSQQWHSSNTDTKWDDTSVKKYLNGTTANGNSNGFLQTIISRTDGTYWESMISNHKWYNADQSTNPNTTVEPKTSWTDEASKIGLMYASDFIAASGKSTSNWLHIKNGWSTNTAVYEWLMSRVGKFIGGYSALFISSSSGEIWYQFNSTGVTNAFAVRPAFYLQSGVNLTGEGTKEHPYIIATMNNA